jgi:Holliday junction resolvase
MNAEVYVKLRKLKRKYGSHEFGRICQALLELTLRRLGFDTRGRPVERPDITCERGEERYAIECKTTEGPRVKFTERDVEGVLEFQSTGKIVPCFAVLAIEPHSEWVIANGLSLKPQTYDRIALKARELTELSQEVNLSFPQILEDYFDLAMSRGSEGLRSRLATS